MAEEQHLDFSGGYDTRRSYWNDTNLLVVEAEYDVISRIRPSVPSQHSDTDIWET